MQAKELARKWLSRASEPGSLPKNLPLDQCAIELPSACGTQAWVRPEEALVTYVWELRPLLHSATGAPTSRPAGGAGLWLLPQEQRTVDRLLPGPAVSWLVRINEHASNNWRKL